MRRFRSHAYVLGAWVLTIAAVTTGGTACSSSSNGADGGHDGGHDTGSDSASDAGDAGGVAFMAFAPCPSQSDYASSTTDIAFGGALGLVYSPACLKIATGTAVTFSGDFTTHPLAPSTSRGTPASNPIVETDAGTTMSFTFDTAGFYGFYCLAHGTDEGDGMAGMIWVE